MPSNSDTLDALAIENMLNEGCPNDGPFFWERPKACAPKLGGRPPISRSDKRDK